MMLVVVALLVWFALSVPAACFVGRLLTAHNRAHDLPVRMPVAMSAHRLIGR